MLCNPAFLQRFNAAAPVPRRKMPKRGNDDLSATSRGDNRSTCGRTFESASERAAKERREQRRGENSVESSKNGH